MSAQVQSTLEAPPAEKLAPVIAKGVLWAYLTYAGSKALVFGSTIILARLLTPADFGIVGFATIVTDYLGTLQDFGVGEALVQRKANVDQAANATFVVSVATGVVLFAAAVVLAPFAAGFFDEPLVTPILTVLALSHLITSFGTVHDALLVKNLDFKQRILPQVVRAVFKGGTAIAFALAGYGVWSIVLGQVLGAVAGTVALWIIVPWRPGRAWDNRVLRDILGFGAQIIGMGFIGNIEANLDYVIIGKALGESALGLYTLAFRAPELLIINLVAVVADVAFPAFSKLQDDRPALQRTLLGALHYITLVAVPAGIGLALIAGPFVHVFYTSRWQDAIPSMQVLAVWASLRAMTYNIGDVYKAIRRADVLNKLGLVSIALLIPGMLFGANYGILGVAAAHAVVAAFNLVVEILVLWKLLDIPPWHFSRTLSGPIISTLGMAAIMALTEMLLRSSDPRLQLILLVISGTVAYAGSAWLANRAAVQSALRIVLHIFGLTPRVA